jgi:hypothetical protein
MLVMPPLEYDYQGILTVIRADRSTLGMCPKTLLPITLGCSWSEVLSKWAAGSRGLAVAVIECLIAM